MFKHAKPSPPSRQPQRDVSQRTSGLYYNSSRTQGNNETVYRNSSARQASQPKNWLRKLSTILIIGVIGVLVVYELALGNNPKVIVLNSQESSANNSFLQPTTVYEQLTHQLLSSSLVNRTKLTIDTASIAAKLQKQFPELANASLSLPLIGHQPILYIVPATPALVLNNQNVGAFLVSSSGKTLQKIVSGKTPTTGLPIVSTQDTETITVGKAVLSPTDISFLQQILAQFNAAKLPIQSLTLASNNQELDVKLANQPYYVKFNLNDSADAKQQIGTFLATQHYLAGKNITPGQYVDVRVVGRVYYK